MFEQNINQKVSLIEKLDFYENSFLMGNMNKTNFLNVVLKVVKEDLTN